MTEQAIQRREGIRGLAAGSRRADAGRRFAIPALGAVGSILVGSGALLPWISLHAGLRQLTGMTGLSGWLLLASAAATLLLSLALFRFPSPRLGLALAGIGFLTVSGCVYLLVQLVSAYRELSADPLLVAAMGPGLWVSTGGALLVFATVFIGSDRDGASVRTRSTPRRASLIVALTLAVAGSAHLALVPGHLGQSPAFGLAFLLAGLAQLGLAARFATSRQTGRLLVITVALSALFIGAYVTDATVGLPFHAHAAVSADHAAPADHAAAPGHAHGDGDHATGHGHEAPTSDTPVVTPLAATTLGAEALTILVGVSMLWRRLRPRASRVTGLISAGLCLSLLLAACGQADPDTSPPPPDATPPPAARSPTASPMPTATASPTATPAESTPQPGGTDSVEVELFAFLPQELTVRVGTEVTWTNLDSAPHTVTAGSRSDPMPELFDSGEFGQGESFTHAFTEPGEYRYYCERHPAMEGVVVVEP